MGRRREALLGPRVRAGRACAAVKRQSAACCTSPPALPSASAIADGGTDGKISLSCASAYAKTATVSCGPKERNRTAAHALRRGVCPHWSVMGRTACCFVGDAICCGAVYAGAGTGFGAACARNMLPGGRPQHSKPTQRIRQSVTACVCASVRASACRVRVCGGRAEHAAESCCQRLQHAKAQA